MKVGVYLSDEEIKFLSFLANHDNKIAFYEYKMTVARELNILATIKIRDTMREYKEKGLYD